MGSTKWLEIAYQKLKEKNFKLPAFELCAPLNGYLLPELSPNEYEKVKLLSKADIKECPKDELFDYLPKTQRSFLYLEDILEENDNFLPQIVQYFEAEYKNEEKEFSIELSRRIFPFDIKDINSKNVDSYRSWNTFFISATYHDLESAFCLYLGEDFACPRLWNLENKPELIDLLEPKDFNEKKAEYILSNINPVQLIDCAVDLAYKLNLKLFSE